MADRSDGALIVRVSRRLGGCMDLSWVTINKAARRGDDCAVGRPCIAPCSLPVAIFTPMHLYSSLPSSLHRLSVPVGTHHSRPRHSDGPLPLVFPAGPR